MDRELPKTRQETKKSGKNKDKTIYSNKHVRAMEALREKKGK